MTTHQGEFVLAFDLGGTNLRAATVTSDGTVLSKARVATPKESDVSAVMAAIREVGEACTGSTDGLLGVSAAVPATVDYRRGVSLKAPNLAGFDGFGIRDALEELFGTTAVVENDANASAVGEAWIGSSKGSSDSIMVTLGTGVGGGIIIGGGLLRGADGTAGEIGHICVEPEGIECGCGARGCVEQYASASAIVRMARELMPDFPESPAGSRPEITSADIFHLAMGGDLLALEVFRRMGYYLGIVTADLINIFNPEVIVLGGGASAAWDAFIGHVVAEVDSRAFEEPARRVRIVRAGLRDESGLIGAAKLAFDKLHANF